jgi:hypothetical protein
VRGTDYYDLAASNFHQPHKRQGIQENASYEMWGIMLLAIILLPLLRAIIIVQLLPNRIQSLITDPAKLRPGSSFKEVEAHFTQLQAAGFPGFKPVSKSKPLAWVSMVETYYKGRGKGESKKGKDKKEKKESKKQKQKKSPVTVQFIKDLISQRALLVGSDTVFFGANNRSRGSPLVLIALNDNFDLAASFVHELEAIHGKTHSQCLREEAAYKKWLHNHYKKEARRKDSPVNF